MGDRLKVTLLVLDENAGTDEKIQAYNLLLDEKRELYPTEGMILMANSKAIEGMETDIAKRTGIFLYPYWKESLEYQQLLMIGLEDDDVYLMKPSGNGRSWRVSKAGEDDFFVLQEAGKLDVKPRYNVY